MVLAMANASRMRQATAIFGARALIVGGMAGALACLWSVWGWF
jgi:hypothetical protein